MMITVIHSIMDISIHIDHSNMAYPLLDGDE